MNREIVVGLATGSALKKEATVTAFEKVFSGAKVSLQCFATSSEINEQPIGYEETIRGLWSLTLLKNKGATNRLNNMKKVIPEGTTLHYKVAIENGLIRVSGNLASNCLKKIRRTLD